MPPANAAVTRAGQDQREPYAGRTADQTFWGHWKNMPSKRSGDEMKPWSETDSLHGFNLPPYLPTGK
ncbi:MAG: hypothetical protein PHX61_08025 [Alphaproteobacteria bacterium]|nr:hypothetical protein [Alphaproteobacteria bacterium]